MNIYKIVLVVSLVTANSVNAQTTAGKTLISKGKVSAIANDKTRALKRRSIIYDNDVVTTGKKSKAQLRMADGGMIALKESTELLISDYRFSDENGRGSVVMELVKGGLRSVTGAIKAENGDYNLKTPTGSIGIRGTHYEIELIEGDMFLAVWDGAIDVTVETGGSESTVSFGDGEDYSFGVVSEEGEVTQLLEAPENFNEGHSTDDSEEEDEESESNNSESTDDEGDSEDGESSDENNDEGNEENSDESNDEATDENEEGSSESDENSQIASETDSSDTSDSEENDDSEGSLIAVDTSDNSTLEEPENVAEDVAISEQTELVTSTISEEFQQIEDNAPTTVEDDFNSIDTSTTEELLSQRSGSFNYNNVESFSVTSSAGAISNFNMNMNINFDNGTIPTGQISFDDAGGEWFAAFSGIISVDQLNLDISFASHGNNLADGDINASFFDGLNSVVGEFDFHEIHNPNNKVNGSFLLK
ncbi:FecR domain-containing protein [Psychrosphaera sp. F3M07]|uniref:FecR family protein n=1 Tax=Psychrosphaera sp. F3M07 TaxID=2841560 RepID=UPI001C08944C|nr:FecR family protein [Psychrosphaera sp. F3M07]MBU2916918.1 FecR domain-containing protein [Psychrosphaera sp. F3M07]